MARGRQGGRKNQAWRIGAVSPPRPPSDTEHPQQRASSFFECDKNLSSEGVDVVDEREHVCGPFVGRSAKSFLATYLRTWSFVNKFRVWSFSGPTAPLHPFEHVSWLALRNCVLRRGAAVTAKGAHLTRPEGPLDTEYSVHAAAALPSGFESRLIVLMGVGACT